MRALESERVTEWRVRQRESERVREVSFSGSCPRFGPQHTLRVSLRPTERRQHFIHRVSGQRAFGPCLCITTILMSGAYPHQVAPSPGHALPHNRFYEVSPDNIAQPCFVRQRCATPGFARRNSSMPGFVGFLQTTWYDTRFRKGFAWKPFTTPGWNPRSVLIQFSPKSPFFPFTMRWNNQTELS